MATLEVDLELFGSLEATLVICLLFSCCSAFLELDFLFFAASTLTEREPFCVEDLALSFTCLDFGGRAGGTTFTACNGFDFSGGGPNPRSLSDKRWL